MSYSKPLLFLCDVQGIIHTLQPSSSIIALSVGPCKTHFTWHFWHNLFCSWERQNTYRNCSSALYQRGSMRCVIPACVHQIHEDSAKSCLEVQRQAQGAAASQGMPHAKSCIHSQLGWGWAGCSVQELPRTTVKCKVKDVRACELHPQAVMPCPCLQLPAEAGKDGNAAVASNLHA